MLLENEIVFKKEYQKIFGKELPDNVLFVENLKYQKGKIKFYLRTQFVVTLNNVFHNSEYNEEYLQRWNSNDGLASVCCYEQEYIFYSDEKVELLKYMQQHIEMIRDNIPKKINDVQSVYAFFKVIR
jgi:hypothetical protein